MDTNRVVVSLIRSDGTVRAADERPIRPFDVAVTWSAGDGIRRWRGKDGRALAYYLGHVQTVVGFDILRYDIHILRAYLRPDERAVGETLLWRTVDLWDLLRLRTGLRVSLNQVAVDTLGQGTRRPRLGTADREEAFRYCERNVELIRALDDYRRAFGLVYLCGLAVKLPTGQPPYEEAA